MAIKKAPKKTTTRGKTAATAKSKPVKQGVKRKTAVTAASAIVNPFDKGTVRNKVATKLLRKGNHSWDDLKEVAGGTLSTRTMGAIIVALEDLGARFDKGRNAELGVFYTFNPKAALIGNHDGADATGEHVTPQPRTAKKAAPAKKAAATKPVAKKAPVTKKTAKKRSAR